MKAKIKNALSFLFKFALSACLLAYLFHKIDWTTTKAALKSADIHYLFAAIIVFSCTYVLILLRWLFFLKALHLDIPLFSIISSFFVGLFFNLFLPTSTGGDIVKTFALFKDTHEKAKVVASVVADRLWGFLSIVAVATVAFIFGYRLLNDNTLFLSIGVLTTISGGITLVLFNEKLYSFGCRIFSFVPKVKAALMRFHYAIAFLKNKKWALLIPILLSCCSQGLLALSFYFVSKALHQDIAFLYFLIFVPILCVVSSLPSIAGLGVRDLGAAYLFAKVGMATGIAVSMTLINFMFMVAAGLIGGAFYVFALSPRRVQHNKTDSGMEIGKV